MNPELNYILCNAYVPIICVTCFLSIGCIKCCCVDSKSTIHDDFNDNDDNDDNSENDNMFNNIPIIPLERD
jgi:hypothetical protein